MQLGVQPAETNGTAAVPTDKRPLKRLKKAAVADAPKVMDCTTALQLLHIATCMAGAR